MENILVVDASSAAKGGVGQQTNTSVSLRMTDAQAAKVAFAVDNGKVWLALRPAVNARSTSAGLVTTESEVLGLPPLPVSQRVIAAYLKEFRSGSR
jgi:Flp pilus assembly protein CpaB